jgi:hypothetical protein
VPLDERQVEFALRDARRVASMARELTAQLLRDGHDPMPMLAALQRKLEQAVEQSRADHPCR